MKELDIYNFPEFKRPFISAVNIIGGQTNLSRLLNVSRQAVNCWINVLDKGVPANRCSAIEALTKGQITKNQLRPDVYGEDYIAPKLTIEEELNRTIKKLQVLLKGCVFVDENRLILRAKPTKKGAK